MPYNIAGAIILYNPELEEIKKNISTYINNLSALIVIDNSDHANANFEDTLKDWFDDEKIIYINNNGNIGIATALNQACHTAKSLSYDWLLTMDQDSSFLDFSSYVECLDSLNPKIADTTAITAVSAHHNSQDKFHQNYSNDTTNYTEKFFVITSGNFLNLKLFDVIGGFEDKLFIDAVDFDYCVKAQTLGYKVIEFENIYLEHQMGTPSELKNLFTRKVKSKRQHSPTRIYYFIRNYLFLWSKYKTHFPEEFNFIKTFNVIVHKTSKIIIYEENKAHKLKAIVMGITHFMKGQFGKYSV